MKLVFWLLDVNYEVSEGTAQAWLWGIGETGKRVLILDETFTPYFYAVLEYGTEPSSILEKIKRMNLPSILNVEMADRKYFGKPTCTLRISCQSPESISKIVSELRKIEGVKECLEDDIRFSMRYMIDNNIVPCSWHEVEVIQAENKKDVQVDQFWQAKSTPKILEKTETPKLRTLAFTVLYYSREGTPKADRNPVIMISVADSEGTQKQFVSRDGKDDKNVLQEFVDWVRECDPDIIVGFGSNQRDWPYLLERCRQYKTRLYVDRTKTEPHTSTYGHVSITGRANIDLMDYADEFPEVKVKTLENLADYLDVQGVKDTKAIEDFEIADYWDNDAKRQELKKFSAENSQKVMGIAQAVMDFAMQLSSLVSLPLDHVGTAAAGFRVEWFLIKQTPNTRELVPKRIEQPYRSYAGGLVLKPEPGLHENIAVLDFKSMYPNLMITYNLSPDTYVRPDEPDPPEGVFVAPEVKHKFRKSPPGFYKEVLTHLIGVREQVRSRMKKLKPGSLEHRVLDARQKAVKVITNASYGYAGWVGARWYVKPLAEAAAAWGRHTITNAIEMAKKAGLQVVYGDTDSIFLSYDTEKVANLESQVKEKLRLEIGLDKIFVRVFFTEAKKRYAGLLSDGRLDIVGLEVIRGDWATIAKDVQESVLKIILKEQSPQKAEESVQSFVEQLRKKQTPFKDLIIWKTLSKPIDEYEVKASHVEAAKMLQQKGWKLSAGDKVGYVIVSGEGKLHQRVKPYIFTNYGEVDLDYYVSKQIVPAAARILESFGITEVELLAKVGTGKSKSRALTEFLGD